MNNKGQLCLHLCNLKMLSFTLLKQYTEDLKMFSFIHTVKRGVTTHD